MINKMKSAELLITSMEFFLYGYWYADVMKTNWRKKSREVVIVWEKLRDFVLSRKAFSFCSFHLSFFLTITWTFCELPVQRKEKELVYYRTHILRKPTWYISNIVGRWQSCIQKKGNLRFSIKQNVLFSPSSNPLVSFILDYFRRR